MTDYNKLVEALRYCAENFGCPIECPRYSPADEGVRACESRLEKDAAAAIEELIESVHIRDKTLDELNHYIWKLEAEVKRLKEANDELREAQTYIDHYGDRWMTSAKDVPSSAYEHGYADGMAEVKAQLPKRGEWIEENRRPRSSQFICSECHRTAYDPQPTRDKAWKKQCRYAYCPNCGAKMEVQDG